MSHADDGDDLPDDAVAEDVPTDDAVSGKSYERKLNAQERDAREAEAFWQQVFNHPIGRREMWRILDAAHTFEERFACGPNGFPNREATWFEAGKQSFGLQLFMSWQRIYPEGVFGMQREHDPRLRPAKPPRKQRGA